MYDLIYCRGGVGVSIAPVHLNIIAVVKDIDLDDSIDRRPHGEASVRIRVGITLRIEGHGDVRKGGKRARQEHHEEERKPNEETAPQGRLLPPCHPCVQLRFG
jgi:hypothetical protein